METVTPPWFDWGVATVTLKGQSKSGDAFLVKELPDGFLVAVIDGLGHGEEAAVAASKGAEVIAAHAGEGLIPLIRLCHEALRDTRGAVLSAVWVSARDGSLAWAGVGNVEGVLFRRDAEARPACETLLLRGGVVGHHLPALQAAVLPLVEGDTIVLATDGVRGDFRTEKRIQQPPQQLAAHLLARYSHGRDDGLVLVGRYRGGGS
jgi:hypothetical protein